MKQKEAFSGAAQGSGSGNDDAYKKGALEMKNDLGRDEIRKLWQHVFQCKTKG